MSHCFPAFGPPQVIPNFRIRTIPVLGTTPAIFGLAAAAHVVTQLAQQPISPEPVFRCRSADAQGHNRTTANRTGNNRSSKNKIGGNNSTINKSAKNKSVNSRSAYIESATNESANIRCLNSRSADHSMYTTLHCTVSISASNLSDETTSARCQKQDAAMGCTANSLCSVMITEST
jgi:hypothetical protein